ncbi:MAG: hypothetical protein VKQ33_14585 [Candidatus Sericytochromatia bacterium]|nr:hypothetical protein [Candidatus Sericytochromatia bacterium]
MLRPALHLGAVACVLATGLAGCVQSLPTTAAAALALSDFSDADRLPGAPAPSAAPTPTASLGPVPRPEEEPEVLSPFDDERHQDVDTPTRFTPVLSAAFDQLKAGGLPTATLDVYQVKGELEVRELRLLLERASFRYERLKPGVRIGDGRLDVGTPPKMSLPATITVTETDGATYALATVKASNMLATVYVADMRIKQQGGHLSVVSISNFARGNDRNGQHTTEASARIVQRLYPGYIQLPGESGAMRMRVLIYSEPDPGTETEGLRVFRQTLGVAP